MRLSTSPAYTLVELLIAMSLSLLLLLGVAEMFQRVGGSMKETRSAMSIATQLNDATMLLRQDLARIPDTLPTKPERIKKLIDGIISEVDDKDGYLTIIEGPDTPSAHPYIDESGNRDVTVGDVDDIIAFTARAQGGPLFRGLIRGEIAEREAAEIIWFVRGNTLYRRVRLIDNETAEGNHLLVGSFPSWGGPGGLAGVEPEAGQYAIVKDDETSDGGPQRYDAVQGADGLTWRVLLTPEDLARRARRFGNDGLSPNLFPHPLYGDGNEGWYYLRMPTLEETDYWSREGIQDWKTAAPLPHPPEVEKPDLWNQPYFFPERQDRKSGSLKKSVREPRNYRTGEDVVLTNVLSFNIEVWCPSPTTKDFVDLGTGDWISSDANLLHGFGGHVWDSWTTEYKKSDGTVESPPFSASLEAVRITIRCFDPASRIIRQVTVVHRFE